MSYPAWISVFRRKLICPRRVRIHQYSLFSSFASSPAALSEKSTISSTLYSTFVGTDSKHLSHGISRTTKLSALISSLFLPILVMLNSNSGFSSILYLAIPVSKLSDSIETFLFFHPVNRIKALLNQLA